MTSLAANTDEIVLQLYGRLEADAAAALRNSFEQLIASPVRRVVLDLSSVVTMDGSGLGAIAFLFKRLTARGGTVSVAGATGQPLAMLDDLGLRRVLGLPRRKAPSRRWFGGLSLARGV